MKLIHDTLIFFNVTTKVENQINIPSDGLTEAYSFMIQQFIEFLGREGRFLSPESIKIFLAQPKKKGEGNYSSASIALRKTALF